MPVGLALVDEGAIRMAPLLVLPQLLTERGLDPGRVIGEGGSDLRCFDDPDKTIAFPALGRLLVHAVSATGCSHLGLEIGRRNSLEAFGASAGLSEASTQSAWSYAEHRGLTPAGIGPFFVAKCQSYVLSVVDNHQPEEDS